MNYRVTVAAILASASDEGGSTEFDKAALFQPHRLEETIPLGHDKLH